MTKPAITQKQPQKAPPFLPPPFSNIKARLKTALNTISHSAVLVVVLYQMPAYSAAQQSFQATAYYISGVLEERLIQPKGISTNTFPFSVWSNNCQWRFKVQPNGEAVEYTEIGYDGEYMYRIDKYPNRQPTHTRDGEGEAVSNIAAANIYQIKVPVFGTFPQAGPLWLAFCSRCYFQNSKNGHGLPPGGLGKLIPYTRENAVKMNWTLSGALSAGQRQRALPKHVVYHTEPEKSEAPRQNVIQTNIVFECLTITNRYEHVFPLKTRTISYKRVGKQTSDAKDAARFTMEKHRIYTTTVTNLQKLAHPVSFRPKMPGNTLVNDTRFYKDEDISFGYLTSNWLSKAEAKETGPYARELQRSRGTNWFALSAIGLLIASGAGTAVWYKTTKTQKR